MVYIKEKYIQMDINKFEKSIQMLVEDFKCGIDRGDFEGEVMALEIKSGVSYQEIYNEVMIRLAKNEIDKKLRYEKDYNVIINVCKKIEKKYEVNIDYTTFDIEPLYV